MVSKLHVFVVIVDSQLIPLLNENIDGCQLGTVNQLIFGFIFFGFTLLLCCSVIDIMHFDCCFRLQWEL